MKKTKIMQLSLALVLIACLLIGCAKSDKKTGSDGANTVDNQNEPEVPSVNPTPFTDPIVQENEAVAGIIQSADNLLNQGYYAQAYRTLSDAITKYGARQDLSSALSNCEQLYVQDALNRAENKFNESKDYEGAIDILMLAQVDLPDSVELQNAIELYQSYRPVKLSDLEPFYEDNADDSRGSWLKGFGYYWSSKTTDNIGNEYQSYWEGRGGGLTAYRINGKYSRMTGIVFTPSHLKNDKDLGYVLICGNGRELWNSGQVGMGIEPVYFDIDLTGITELTIKSYWGDTSNYSPFLADIWLYAEP